MTMHSAFRSGLVALAATVMLAGSPATAQDKLPELAVSSFPSPTPSFWVPNLIHKLGLDEKHGFRLTVESKPSQVAYADFVSGASKLCYCIAPAAAARFVERGSDIAQLWIVQTQITLIITADPEIRTPKDLEGRTLGADTTTGSWAIAASLLTRAGADLGKVDIRSGSISNSAAELSLGRVDAIAASPTAIAQLQVKEPGKYHAIDISDTEAVGKLTGGKRLPSWGVGAWNDWIDTPGHDELLQRLYAATVDFIALTKSEPERLAKEIAAITGVEEEAALTELTTYWNFELAPVSEYEQGIRLLGSDLLPNSNQLDGPLTEENYKTLISTFKPRTGS